MALAFAFYIEGFLMENHRKHEPLDQAVHTLLVRWPFLMPVKNVILAQAPFGPQAGVELPSDMPLCRHHIVLTAAHVSRGMATDTVRC